MTHTLTITLADAADLAWAQATVTAAHHAPVLNDNRRIFSLTLHLI